MDDNDHVATLVMLIGPPAVGKMTVGQELARLSGFHLLHHHQMLDLISPYFPFDTPPFNRLVQSYRVQFVEEAAQAGLNLITTGAWPFDQPALTDLFWQFVRPYVERGHRVCFVELLAPLAVLLERNQTANRQRHKRTEWSTDVYLRELIPAHRYDSSGAFPFDLPHLRLETEYMSAAETARRIIEHYGLPVSTVGSPGLSD